MGPGCAFCAICTRRGETRPPSRLLQYNTFQTLYETRTACRSPRRVRSCTGRRCSTRCCTITAPLQGTASQDSASRCLCIPNFPRRCPKTAPSSWFGLRDASHKGTHNHPRGGARRPANATTAAKRAVLRCRWAHTTLEATRMTLCTTQSPRRGPLVPITARLCQSVSFPSFSLSCYCPSHRFSVTASLHHQQVTWASVLLVEASPPVATELAGRVKAANPTPHVPPSRVRVVAQGICPGSEEER